MLRIELYRDGKLVDTYHYQTLESLRFNAFYLAHLGETFLIVR